MTTNHLFATCWIETASLESLFSCLLQDMEMLRNEEWEPDEDSIAAHCDVITEIQRRVS
jgi:hypothetical protein